MKKFFTITSLIVLTLLLIGCGLIIWHSNAIVSSMADVRVVSSEKQVAFYQEELSEVEVINSDGIKLHAWQFGSNTPKGVVVILHGMHGLDAASLLDYGKFFKDQGFDAFCLDLRAHGRSEGEELTFGYKEVDDVTALLDWIRLDEKYQEKPIILFGLSMGGSIVIQTAAVREDVDMVISVCAYDSYLSQVKDYMTRSNIPKSIVKIYSQALKLVLAFRFDTNPEQAAPLNQIEKIAPRPILLIHGEADEQTAVYQAYNLKDKAGDNAKLWVIEDKGHLIVEEILNDHNKWYRDEIARFIEDNLPM